LHSDLVAFVGPNEAGKSSVLLALTHLNDDRGFEQHERSRRQPETFPELRWQIQLEDADRQLIAEVHDAAGVNRVTVTKGADGIRRWSYSPVVPKRDITHRSASLNLLKSLTDKAIAPLATELGEDPDLATLMNLLSSPEESYSEAEVENLRVRIETLRQLMQSQQAADPESALASDQFGKAANLISEAVSELQTVIALETAATPTEKIKEILEGRLPELRLYRPEDRDLHTEYDLSTELDNPHPALRHLADVADLDLAALKNEVLSGNTADATSRKKEANKKLKKVFAAWKQEGVAIQIETDSTALHIQVTTGDGVSALADRSEGMRWFASLLAFMNGGGDNQILLADEIETHLHYDAQADLVELLAKQRSAAKVIYTTHSFGCLPNDMGNGVRVVRQLEGGWSSLQNGFWSEGAGFSPLMLSMGAAAAAFTPTRRAIIGEGPTEAIVLPTLFAEASGERTAFQVAPGLSSVAAIDIPGLQSEAGHVGYLVDGDRGGLALRDVLIKAKVSVDRIVVLVDPDSGDALETEDLIDLDIYVRAVNDELRCWNTMTAEIGVADIPRSMRTKAVDKWCESNNVLSPDKAAVAQRVVNLAWYQKMDAAPGASDWTQAYAQDRRSLILNILGSLNTAVSAP